MDKTIYTREYATLLKLLVEMRVDSGLTQSDLAKKIGLTQSAVSKFERGDRRLDVIQLRTITRHFGVSFQTFIDKLENQISKRRSRRKLR